MLYLINDSKSAYTMNGALIDLFVFPKVIMVPGLGNSGLTVSLIITTLFLFFKRLYIS